MLARTRRFARLVPAACLALLLAVPAVAMYVRNTVHFAASFDVPGAPGGGLQADVGQIAIWAPPTEFVVVPDDKGGGQLSIHDAGTTAPATLVGTFKTNFNGSKLDASCTVRPAQNHTPLRLRFMDETDSGMIDATFGGDGLIQVNGVTVMPYEPGVNYHLQLVVTDPLVGPTTWALLVTALEPGGAVGAAAGPVAGAPSGQLVLKSVQIVRPAGAPAGQFLVDDLKAVSTSFTFK
jgi:hypothetical protein